MNKVVRRKVYIFNDGGGLYKYFSNMFPCEVKFQGIVYPSSEHAYQAQKTFHIKTREKIAAIANPVEAKRFARTIGIRTHWEEVKFDLMVRCLLVKFSKQPFKTYLLKTGNYLIIEDAGKWDDCEWGIGKRGKGKNKLGLALMLVRNKLRDEENE